MSASRLGSVTCWDKSIVGAVCSDQCWRLFYAKPKGPPSEEIYEADIAVRSEHHRVCRRERAPRVGLHPSSKSVADQFPVTAELRIR
jgi:hypothetical protein